MTDSNVRLFELNPEDNPGACPNLKWWNWETNKSETLFYASHSSQGKHMHDALETSLTVCVYKAIIIN